jgi:lysophospholipase L1-like esterase
MDMKKAQSKTWLAPRLAALALLTVGLLGGAAAAPASALAPAEAREATGSFNPAGDLLNPAGGYVALGDSFTAGQGAPPYTPGPCLRSRYASYPALVSVLSPYRLVANRACTAATVEDVRGQLAGLSPATRASTRLVTMTVGGIDAGSNDILAACAPDLAAPICNETIQASTERLAVLGPQLAHLYSTVAASLPAARVVVMNYPLIFEPGLLPLGDQFNASTALLNAVIEGAVAATGNPRITLTDVTQEFAGHGIGSPVPYIAFDPAHPTAPPNFHPNALGNSLGYARALANDGVLRW